MGKIIKPVVGAASSFLGRLLGRAGKTPQAPPRSRRYNAKDKGPGSRGIAMGSAANPNRSAENIAKWENLSGSEIEQFLYEGKAISVHSSNVESIRYDINKSRLYVDYLDGSGYWYDGVSEDEAYLATTYQSKGSYIWDTLRIRGTKTGHKKSYHRYR